MWQKVAELQRSRVQIVHVNASQKDLFGTVACADAAINAVRDAVCDLCGRVGQAPPAWITDDDDPGWDDGSSARSSHLSISYGVDPEAAATVRVAYVAGGSRARLRLPSSRERRRARHRSPHSHNYYRSPQSAFIKEAS